MYTNQVLIAVLILFSSFASIKGGSTSKAIGKETPATSSYKFGVHFTGTSHLPVHKGGVYWDPYITAGIHCDFPTYIPKLHVHFTGEAGRINKRNNTPEDYDLLHASVSISYSIPVYKQLISFRPRLGLSNLMISSVEFDLGKILQDPDGNYHNENEYGVLLSLEPVFRMKRFQLFVPIAINLVLSSPEPFITIDFSLNAGALF